MKTGRVAIGIDIGGTGAKGGLVTDDGELLCRVEHPTDVEAGTKAIVGVADELLERAADEGVQVLAVGVGAAGFVDAEAGSVTFAPNLVYDDPNIKEAVAARTHLPVVVDNDANMAVWGERRFGTAQGLDHVALITLGTGIGSGFIIDGRLLRGGSGAAAEFGHTVVELDGPLCLCGLRGCLEQLASGNAIKRMGHEAAAEHPESTILAFAGSLEAITASHVAQAAREMDEVAQGVLRRAGRALGVGLSNVVNVFDPEVIVLGGSVARAGEAYLGPCRDELAMLTAAQRRRPVRLDVGSLGGDAAIVGSAALAFDACA
jgi:glucokinase